MGDSLNRYINTIPKSFGPETNRVIAALLAALAAHDDTIEDAVATGHDQLFVRTSTGTNLDTLGRSLGVPRPATLGLSDTDYQNLIPNLSLKPKQIRKAFYDTADVFWGPMFSRANFTTENTAPFDVSVGDSIIISVDGRPTQTVKVLNGEIAHNGVATAEEMQAILSKIKGTTAEILTDSVTGTQKINIRTNTPGSVGSLEIMDTSTMVSPSKMGFPFGKINILNLDQRVVVYNIRPNELFIEIPSIVPALRRTLKGSHHFHADATLEPAIPPANVSWAGSFFYNPSGSDATVTITSQRATIQQVVNKESVLTSVAVDNNSSFTSAFGELIFGFGTDREEGPIRYRGIPNSNTVLLDPSYIFKFDHPIGENINVISQEKPYVPREDGTDLAIYLTSPSNAREIVQQILESLAAAGIIVTFAVLAPRYKYLVDNPYIDSDDAPSEPPA